MELRIPESIGLVNPNLSFRIGTDIVKNQRISKNLSNHRFISRIFSAQEIKIFEKIKNVKRKIEFLSGRFSAKESITKALNYKLNFNQITILPGSFVEIDQPLKNKINKLLNSKDFYLSVSISHENDYTISFCLAVFIR
ncbi:MAG: holo-ACP synthase [bacterium]